MSDDEEKIEDKYEYIKPNATIYDNFLFIKFINYHLFYLIKIK